MNARLLFALLLMTTALHVRAADAPAGCEGPKAWPESRASGLARHALFSDPKDDAAQQRKLRKQLAEFRSSADALYALAVLQMRDGQDTQAQASLEAALKLPGNSPYLDFRLKQALAQALYRQRKDAEAGALVDALLERHCEILPVELLLMNAQALKDAGQLQKAGERTEALLDNDQRVDAAMMSSGLVLGIQLQCTLKHFSACAQRVVQAAQMPRFAESQRPLLSKVARQLQADPAAAAILLKAQKERLFDADWNSLTPQYETLQPIHAAKPEYPQELGRAGVEGIVEVLITVDGAGQVKDAKVLASEPPGKFDAAALDAARRSQFKPALKKGVGVEAQGVRRYVFGLPD